ncbi:hypothetical protein [Rhizobium leguminosarum]|uniref:hypothetical protein n=1 Tax=Rhizobium leguminosarum TaxID=384 RepID=UPI001FDED552|nr:hypothetical protein [Rhizobium leguminosarum]
MLLRRRGNLATIARKAFLENFELGRGGKAPPTPWVDDFKPAHRCPKTVHMPVHSDKTTDSSYALKAAHPRMLTFVRKACRFGRIELIK